MKTKPFHSMKNATRTAATLMMTLGLGISTALADDSVAVKLSNKSFGSDKDLRANGDSPIALATSYTLRPVGSCHSTGDLAGLILNGSSIREIFGKALKGKVSNPNGTAPFSFVKTFSIMRTIETPFPQVVTLSATVTGGLRADRTPYVNITDFAIDPALPLSGTIVFEPGAKVILAVDP
jgi:hypothetical protein